MIFWRDIVALGVAAAAPAALGAVLILPNVYSMREPLGYVRGTMLDYEFSVGKLSAGGIFDVRLNLGEAIRVRAQG